jgi:hypothetical protein
MNGVSARQQLRFGTDSFDGADRYACRTVRGAAWDRLRGAADVPKPAAQIGQLVRRIGKVGDSDVVRIIPQQ